MSWTSKQWKKLRDKAYREAFVADAVKRTIPFQIRAIMRGKRISQVQLAERSGLTQGVISRAANPAYGNLTLNTIVRVAAGLDVAFVGTFVPFSKLVEFMDAMSEHRFAHIATFAEEGDESLNVEQLPLAYDSSMSTMASGRTTRTATTGDIPFNMARASLHPHTTAENIRYAS